MARDSAVIVRIPVPASLERIRRRHDPLAARGVPAHVTLLFPFAGAEELTPAVRRSLAAIASSVEPFDVRFARVRRFPDAVWLAPEPEEPFRDLTRRLEAAFPDHPPYRGQHAEVIPHLTIALGTEAELDGAERIVEDCPPFDVTARAMEVIAETDRGRWKRHWRLRFG